MAHSSCLAALTILQAHGLTPTLLQRFADFCAAGKQGSFTFHTGPSGHIVVFEEHYKCPVTKLEALGTATVGYCIAR